MADWVRVTPVEGRLPRNLNGRRIAEKGEVVDRSLNPVHLARLERAGDVTIIEASEPTPQPEAPAAPVEE